MSGTNVRDALLAVPVPDEFEARQRAWAVVRGAFADREPQPRRRRLRVVIAVAVVAGLAAAALSPPGRSVGGWLRDRVAGEEETAPALSALPAAGRLLVISEEGPWIVRPDGSKRLLGAYDDASFSPNARFVVATEGRRVIALEPDGDPRWSVTRPTPVSDPRWSPSPGFRVAYREGDTLRLVAGNGTGDRLLAENVAAVAPAWRPVKERTILAYASGDGIVRVVEADSGEEVWSADPGALPRQLVWSPDGGLLLVVTAGGRHPLYRAGGRGAGALVSAPGTDVLDAAFAPGTRDLAYAAFDPGEGRTTLFLNDERVQRVEGRLDDVVFSPGGGWLLTGWPEADQFLFLRLPGVSRILVVDDIRREFSPGAATTREFPAVVGWCC